MTDLDVIISNLHWRYSGVTATNRMVAPRIAGLMSAIWFGSDAPDGIGRLSFRDLLRLWRRATPIIWHARRNNEMMAGLLLRALGWPLKLVFTSAAQRHHTWTTRAMMRRMDAIIATSDASASYLKVPHVVIMHGIDTERYAPPADREAEFRKRQTEQAQAAAKKAEDDKDTEARKVNCQNARSHLAAIEAGERIVMVDPATGERSYLDDAGRAKALAQARASVQGWRN